jgi:hypothetical protein
MPFSVVVASTTLTLVYPDGTSATLTMPINAYSMSAVRARFAIFDRNVIIVNSPSIPLWLDPDGVVRPLTVPNPRQAPTVAAGAAGALTGSYRVKVAYCVKDNLGNLLSEGPTSNASAIVTVAAQLIAMTNIPVSTDPAINCRRLYRTATGPGTEYFEWLDIDDNTTTSFSDDAADADLSLLSAPTDHGAAPGRLTLICEWKGRLWGKNTVEPDQLRYSADGKLYGWPETNTLPIQPIGKDRFGITGLIPRRDELGIARRDIIWKVIGSSDEDFRLVKLVEGKGAIAPDSVVIVRDVARWLGDDGVYEWDAEGVRCISDQKVHPWFTTDTYFNRAMFPDAFARYDPLKHCYDLYLAPAGATDFTRWVSYDIARKAWLGPHLTSAFTPTAAGVIFDANEVLQPAVGSGDGYLYVVTPGTYRDSSATAIAMDVTGKFHSGEAPDITHYWGQIALLTKVESGGTLTITPKVGRLDAVAQSAITATLTLGRERLRRPGVGALCQLRFQNSELNQPVQIFGYEIPFHEVGRR